MEIDTAMNILKRETIFEIFIVNALLTIAGTNQQDYSNKRKANFNYCRSFKNCNDCKKTSNLCDWCHDFGCTSYPKFHCPRKTMLDTVWAKPRNSRFCTEVITKSPLFVSASVRQFLRLEVLIDDLTLYERNLMCEFNVDHRIFQVPGVLDHNIVICEMSISNLSEKVVLGSLSLLWGGVEPYSNAVMLVVYQCSRMARNCHECISLYPEFRCGWCQETNSCTIKDMCPRKHEPWITRNHTCVTRFRPYYSHDDVKRYWLRAW